MNNTYTYLNGNVILNDRDGNEYTTPNTDNMYDVVKQENFIEIIESRMNNVQKDILNCEDLFKNDKKKLKSALLHCFICPIIFTIMMYGWGTLFNINQGEMLNQLIVKIMNIFNLHSYLVYRCIVGFIASAIMAFTIGVIIDIAYQFRKKKLKRQLTGKKKELECLKAKKEEAEMALKELKSKSKEVPLEKQPQEFKVIEVNNDLDYETLDKKQTDAFNAGITEYQTLRRVRKSKHITSFR